MFDKELLSLLWVVVCVVLVIGLAYWFTKHVVGKGGLHGLGGGQKNNAIQVIARTAVGKDQQLLLVQAGERYFLLGATAAGISLVAEFTEEEAKQWAEPPHQENGGQPPSFTEALQTVIKQKMGR
jgi:flagellar biogenesis protein FliO